MGQEAVCEIDSENDGKSVSPVFAHKEDTMPRFAWRTLLKSPSPPFYFFAGQAVCEGVIMMARIEAIFDVTGFQIARITSGSCGEDEQKRACPWIDRFRRTPSFCRRSHDGSQMEDLPVGDDPAPPFEAENLVFAYIITGHCPADA
jgi:hypothetical protein